MDQLTPYTGDPIVVIGNGPVGETAALKLHATELLMLLGTAVVLLLERPPEAAQPQLERNVAAEDLSFQQSQLPYNP